MSDTQIILRPEHYYHIFNHAVGNENLFNNDKDYLYFLAMLKKHVLPVSELLAYCLMPNQFHLIIRLKSEDTIRDFINSNSKATRLSSGREATVVPQIDKALSQIFSNFFNTYAKHYNFLKKRTGTLFKRAFRRKEIDDMEYLKRLICYTHQNPLEAGFANKPEEWKYSSYSALIGLQPTLIPRNEIITLFGDLQNFKYCNSIRRELDIE